MNAIFKIYVCLVIGMVAVSCGSHGNGDAVVAVDIERLDIAAARYLSMSDSGKDSVCKRFAPALPLLALMFRVDSSQLAMDVYAQSDAVAVFEPDVESVLSDMSLYENQLGEARGILAKEMPSVEFPVHLYGMVTPYNQSVVLSDSILFIGLNHYLGVDYAGYTGFDEYRRRLKVPERLPVDVVEAVVSLACPYEEEVGSGTVLSRMLYDGAITALLLEALPDAGLADMLGWDDEELQWAENNEPKVWETIVGRKLLYSTDPMDAERLVNPSPAASVVHQDAPGRIGRYIGYKIIKSYINKHPEVTFADVFDSRFYGSRTALMESGYSGK